MSIPVYEKTCPVGVFEQRFIVGVEETDTYGRMCWGALARRMQPITEAHLTACGLDRDALMASGKTWIILWSGMEIARLPEVGEHIVLRIWPSNRKMLMHTRKYAFYTEEGEALLSVASIFMLMNLETRDAADTGDDFPEISTVILENEIGLPKMRLPFPKEWTNSVERTVTAEEIDFNGHMNNSHYLDWAQTIADKQEEQPTSIWIQYNKELLEGEQAEICYEWKETGLFGKICHNGQDAFAFKVVY